MRRGTLIALLLLFFLLSVAAFVQWELGQHPHPRQTPPPTASPASGS